MPTSSECTRSLAVEVSAGEVERETTRVAQSFQKRARIPGFRPGKAPLSLVQKHFDAKIREEVLDALVPAHLRTAFEREKLEPVSTPTLDKLEYTPGSPLKFEASFEVMPAFDLGDYASVRAAMPDVTVTPADVEAAVDNLRQRAVVYEASPAEAVADGLVAVVEARPLGEGAASTPPAEPQELKIEVGHADTLPAFSDALRGMKPGEEREVEVAYPADFPNAGLAGQTRRFHLRLGSIQTKVLPALDDAWVREQTGFASVAELRAKVEANLRSERLHHARHEVENAVLAQLLEQTVFPVPEAMVDKQIENKLERNLRGLAQQGVDPRKLKLDWAKLRAGQHDEAARDVRASLVLDRIAEAEKIEAPPEAVEQELARAAAELRQTPDALRARLTDNGGLDRIKHRMRQERVLEFLLDRATAGAFPRALAAAAGPDASASRPAAQESNPA